MGYICAYPSCSSTATKLCGKCQAVRYCSREHQVTHWKEHKYNCGRLEIRENEKLGKHFIASEDIKAGTLIICESPLIIGPTANVAPLCLGCMKPLGKRARAICSKCHWPICHASCKFLHNHVRECDLFQKFNVRCPKLTNFEIPHPMYDCITPLRCLWMSQKTPAMWNYFSQLQSNVKERVDGPGYLKTKNVVIYLIRTVFGMINFTEEEIHFVCGILETNGFDIPSFRSVAVYDLASILEHSCSANASIHYDRNHRIRVKTTTDIKKGMHVTISYIDPFVGERTRQTTLKLQKYFDCYCIRCDDPTDMGTHISSIKCPKCTDGLMLPARSLADPYVCSTCGNEVDSVEVEMQLVQFNDQYLVGRPCCSHYETCLATNEKYLSTHHFLRNAVKLKLMTGYGEDTCLEALDINLLTRKIEIGEELLALADKFSPGLSRLRAHILYELIQATHEKFSRYPRKIKASLEGKYILRRTANMMKDTIEIYKLDSEDDDSRMLVMRMSEELAILEEILSTEPKLSSGVDVESANVESMAVESIGVKSVVVESAAMKSMPVEPVNVKSMPVEPAAVKPMTVESAAVKPMTVESAAVKSQTVKSTYIERMTVESIGVKSVFHESTDVETLDVDVESLDTESRNSKSINIKSSNLVSLDIDVESLDIKSPNLESMTVDSVEVKSVIANSANNESLDVDVETVEDVASVNVNSVAVDEESLDVDVESIDIESINMKSVAIESADVESVIIDVESIDIESVDVKSVVVDSVNGEPLDVDSVDVESIDVESMDLDSVNVESPNKRYQNIKPATMKAWRRKSPKKKSSKFKRK